MPDIRVTAETRQLEDGSWEACGYPGDGVVRSTATLEAGVMEQFVIDWNTAMGTSWAADEFAYMQ